MGGQASRSWAATAIAAVAVLAAAACSGGSKKAAPPTPRLPAVTYTRTACAIPTPSGQPVDGMQCGTLTVPEDRTKSGPRTVQLAVAVLKSTSASPAPDPMLYLSGGPGQPNLSNNMQAFSRAFAAPVQSKRDLVFFDQRGTGASRPSLACPEVNTAFRAALAADIRGEAQSTGAAAALRACRDRLARDGVDFAAYSSAESAADIADLMQALGYRQYNIYGLSYGTRLALETMRNRPQRIRSVILDSTLPPQAPAEAAAAANFERALKTLVAGCRAEPACAAAYPTLETMYYDLVAQANASPFTVEPADPATGGTSKVVVNGDRILAGTWQALYDTRLLPLLPFAAKSIAGGNTALLTSLAAQVAFTNSDLAQAMTTAVNCNDSTMSLTPGVVASATNGVRQEILDARIGFTTSDDLKRAQDLCRAYGITKADPAETQPVTSSIPTLVLAGEYDPITPPSWGRLAAKTLSRSYFFEFPGSGHAELFGRHDCAIALAASFLDDPSQAPDASCVKALAEPAFLAP
ncbi:MAG: alpha/beta fold hydrolase [Dehalococcoidia bacterium]|nr:alpha/beta fold hydrolase [Dehalococcoidia bacterium]